MMLETFFVRALLAAAGVALFAGPLGCFIVWRRLAYFGDTVAHSALLGVGLGLLLGVDTTAGVIAVTLTVALLLIFLRRRQDLATDTLLGILSHTALSLGLVVVSLLAWLRLDLMSYLFGDILAVSWVDVGVVWLGGSALLIALIRIWHPLLALTVNEDLARAEGVSSLRYEVIFMVLTALAVAIAIKVVGVLLITALLIIPAATARTFARSPEQMALMAVVVGLIAGTMGLFSSLYLNTPSGPSIVLAAALLFALTTLVSAVVPLGYKPRA